MTEEISNKSIRDLEIEYEQKKAEYQKTESLKNKLEATKEVNITEFKKFYYNLDDNIKSIYGLTLSKPIEKMSLTELEEVQNKINNTHNSIYAKLSNYLRTGKVEEISDLLPKTEEFVKETETEPSQQKEDYTAQPMKVQPKDNEVVKKSEDLDIFKI